VIKQMLKISTILDKSIKSVGETAAWLNGILIVVIVGQVVLRYAFEKGLVTLEELQWHLYAVGIMLGMSYCVVRDSHIRLDLLHSRFSRPKKEVVELLGIVFLLIPIVILVMMHSVPYVTEAYRLGERSDSPVGLPYRFIIKAFIPVGFGLLGLAGLSRMIRASLFLTNKSRK
ncbi:uncharacterized protein METZ01_LOCUS513236, partial [marine metagenome]|jgi:TRAP-type mannitol/chloroaromatic compound transport system permease small subunit|tara:strand:- start:29 stop:547 length:519 start_codon:yes stop_codon:yes gene_type:complete